MVQRISSSAVVGLSGNTGPNIARFAGAGIKDASDNKYLEKIPNPLIAQAITAPHFNVSIADMSPPLVPKANDIRGPALPR